MYSTPPLAFSFCYFGRASDLILLTLHLKGISVRNKKNMQMCKENETADDKMSKG
jgi:hypothetical protein